MRYLLLLSAAVRTQLQLRLAAQDAAQDAIIEFTDHPALVVTNINALNMRSSPAIEADNIVGRLQPGQQLHVLTGVKALGSRCAVRMGLIGWSHSDYLIDLPARQLGETRLFLLDDQLDGCSDATCKPISVTSANTVTSTSPNIPDRAIG